MSWLPFIATMAGILAWPTAIIVVALLIRRELRRAGRKP